MKKLMFTILLTLTLASAANVVAQSKHSLETEVARASHAYDTAILNQDKTALAALFADEYTATNENGRVRNKEEDIAAMTSPDLKFTSVNSVDSERRIRIYGNLAVETGKYSVQGTHKGSPFTEEGRYTSTWIKRNGRWQIVADHSSLIKSDSAAQTNDWLQH
jgi:ketosteroid isomerase-like protein